MTSAQDDPGQPLDRVLWALQERAKELSCLYRVEEQLRDTERPLDEVLLGVLEAIPPGWQHPGACQARITLRGRSWTSPEFVETPWELSAPIVLSGRREGALTAAYAQEFPPADEGPFLKEERRLIDTIAARLSEHLARREARPLPPAEAPAARPGENVEVILGLLRSTDRNLYRRIARRLLNHLAWMGSPEARELLASLAPKPAASSRPEDENRPLARAVPQDEASLERTFHIAAAHLQEAEIVSMVQAWIREDRVEFLVQALETPYTSLVEIGNAVERFQRTGVHSRELPQATQVGLVSALARRLLTEQQDSIAAVRRFAEVEDFFELIARTIQLPRSHGRLGGKASGLFLARQVLRRSPELAGMLAEVHFPRTWYLPSDGILHFVAYNDLDEVYTWKYRQIDQIRQEYPHVLQLFKNSRFPPEIEQGVARALDDLGDKPLIVRSSSLLEDRAGSAFSGKYKSLFLPNRGDKRERLAALLDAIAEVYASTFSPDPIQYRSERGLLEHHEEMAVMIQEVVGTRVGRYFLPAFSGVAFSHNELRWSPRIRREDGLLRLVPGLGTRAVDRLADDYPMLVAPGQPGLRVNVSAEDVRRYAPRMVDVIDLEGGGFETLTTGALLREVGAAYPLLAELVSVFESDRIRPAGWLDLDGHGPELVFNFEGLVSRSPFVARMRALLDALRESLATAVDLEFAHDGRDLYLVQCRPQSRSADAAPAQIPRGLPPERVLFSAHRHVSNGRLPDLTHVVYVDPDGYAGLASLQELRSVGRAVGQLNALLPKRRFALLGPGRWGSRGDVRLGVGVTYADISNAALLVEIARKRGHYVPDLSFGTHFFQDLVESQIRYLPLYPDDPGVAFREDFFRDAPSLLGELLPEHAGLSRVVRVIEIPRATGGQVLRVAMNAEQDEALGYLVSADAPGELVSSFAPPALPAGDHSRWRLGMAERLASSLDAPRFGVRAVYVYGSALSGSARPASDLDLLVHFAGSPEQRSALDAWLQGWSLALGEANFLRTGQRVAELLDVRFVGDAEVQAQSGHAAKIHAVTDAARELPLGGASG
jgi:pyruvate,water dikinase